MLAIPKDQPESGSHSVYSRRSSAHIAPPIGPDCDNKVHSRHQRRGTDGHNTHPHCLF